MGSTYWSRRASNSAILLLFFLLFATRLFAQVPLSDFQFRKVARVQLKADGPIEEQTLRDLIEITPGVDILTTSKIRKSIELLWATGNFTNIIVDASLENNQAVLTFILRLVYRMDSIDLTGNEGVSDDKIRERLGLRRLEPYTPEKILRGRESILGVLRENGYYNAEVTPDVLLNRNSKTADLSYLIEAGNPAFVNSITFTGEPHFTREQLFETMSVDPGDRFREPNFNRDLERLERLYDRSGFIEKEIKVAGKEIQGNRVDLELNIRAGNQLVLKTIGYEFSEQTLRETIPIWVEHSYNDDTLEEGKRQLYEYLQRKGYYDAEVSWQKEILADRILINYTINPGPRYKVRDIGIQGNKFFTERDIRDIMQTNETGRLGAQRFVTSVFEADLNRILGAYRQNGFLFARFTKREIVRVPEKEDINIVLAIDEGPQVMVSEIRLRGNEVFTTDFLLQNFTQKVGQPVSEGNVKFDSNYLIALYSDNGYPKVEAQNRIALSRDKTRAIIEYRINEGEQIFVDRIVFSGNYRTEPEVIKESLFFEEDEPFSLRKITESQSKLYSLNIFDRVDIDVPRPDNLQKFQSVFIDLKEAKPYTMTYGVGFQTFDLLRGVFALSNRNLFGTARTLGFQLRGGFKEGRALVSYIDPHLFFHRVNSTLSGFAEHRVRESFSFTRYGVSLQAERRLNPERAYLPVGQPPEPLKSLFFRYDFEDIDTFGEVDLSPLNRRFLAIHISSLSASYVRDARDNPIDPGSGTFLSSDLQYASSYLGSETDFLKSFSQIQYYLPLRRNVIATSFRIGLAKGFRETIELPLSQRFFAGGGRSIRGFELDTASPIDPVSGEPLGGNALLVFNLEYRFPIYGALGGVVFFDYGNVFSLIEAVDFADLRKTTGFGLRYRTPIGPLTADWGYKLDRRREPVRESPYEFFISIGHAF